MKKAIILIIMTLSAVLIHAQEDRVESLTRYDSINVDYRTKYVSSFWDNFYIQGAFAGRILCAEEDAQMKFGERLQPGFQLAVGKRILPSLGVRLSGGGARLEGWNSGIPGIYKEYANWGHSGVDPLKLYYESIGISTADGYKQKIKYFEVNADFMVDMLNVFSKNKRFDRRWDLEAYAGVGFLHMCRWHAMSGNSKVSFRLGAVGTYNITDRLGVNAELSYAITDATFDGEIGKGNQFDSYVSGMVGLRWRIGRQGFDVVRLVSPEQYTALNNTVSMIRREVEEESPVNALVSGEGLTKVSLLAPSVVFYPKKTDYNEELQLVNIFKVAQFMNSNPDRQLVIIGNVDGTDRSLARKRAAVVKDVLVNRYSIAASRLSIELHSVNETFGVSGHDQSVNFSITR